MALLNRRPGDTVVYGNTTDGEVWITVHHGASNSHYDHSPAPWEIRLALLETLVRDTIALFGRFNTGWIPSKGHPGLLVDHVPTDHNAHQPSLLDLRRIIHIIQTPRRQFAP